MKGINESGQLSDEDEKALGDAIGEMIDDFGPDFDEEGNPLEEGESDRVRGHRDEAEAKLTTRTRPRLRTRRPSAEEVPA